MKATHILALSVAMSATLSCGHRTVSTATNHTGAQALDVSRVAVCDSASMQRLVNASIRQPKIIIFRGNSSGDTSVVVISADEIIVGDSLTITSKSVISESDSSTINLAVVKETHEKASTPRLPWAWMLVAILALVALIVLSLRGIGSRR